MHECGPTYVVIGDGGNREGLSQDYMTQPSWCAAKNVRQLSAVKKSFRTLHLM